MNYKAEGIEMAGLQSDGALYQLCVACFTMNLLFTLAFINEKHVVKKLCATKYIYIYIIYI